MLLIAGSAIQPRRGSRSSTASPTATGSSLCRGVARTPLPERPLSASSMADDAKGCFRRALDVQRPCRRHRGEAIRLGTALRDPGPSEPRAREHLCRPDALFSSSSTLALAAGGGAERARLLEAFFT